MLKKDKKKAKPRKKKMIHNKWFCPGPSLLDGKVWHIKGL